jgi:hypothetical protein
LVDLRTGEEAINRGLAKRLQQLADERERRERAALAADAEFTAEFLSAARAVFNMIDVDESGDLEKQEIVVAVKSCVEIKILRRVRPESPRRPPRHRRDACSMAWRCRCLTARRSQRGHVIAEK